MRDDMMIPATKHVNPFDTFLAKRLTKGKLIALIMIDLPDPRASKERQYQSDPLSVYYCS